MKYSTDDAFHAVNRFFDVNYDATLSSDGFERLQYGWCEWLLDVVVCVLSNDLNGSKRKYIACDDIVYQYCADNKLFIR